MHIYTHIHITQTRMHTHKHIHVYTHTYTYTYTEIFPDACGFRIRAYIHTHIQLCGGAGAGCEFRWTEFSNDLNLNKLIVTSTSPVQPFTGMVTNPILSIAPAAVLPGNRFVFEVRTPLLACLCVSCFGDGCYSEHPSRLLLGAPVPVVAWSTRPGCCLEHPSRLLL
jgi:hypothetical protein